MQSAGFNVPISRKVVRYDNAPMEASSAPNSSITAIKQPGRKQLVTCWPTSKVLAIETAGTRTTTISARLIWSKKSKLCPAFWAKIAYDFRQTKRPDIA